MEGTVEITESAALRLKTWGVAVLELIFQQCYLLPQRYQQ